MCQLTRKTVYGKVGRLAKVRATVVQFETCQQIFFEIRTYAADDLICPDRQRKKETD